MNVHTKTMMGVLAVLLTVSLAGNFFLGGVVLGKIWSGDGEGGFSARDRAADDTLRTRLGADDRAAIRAVMEGRKADFDRLRKDMRVIRAELRRKSEDPAVSQAMLDDLLRREQEAKADMLRLVRETRAEMMTKVSPAAQGVLKDQRFSRMMPGGSNPRGAARE